MTSRSSRLSSRRPLRSHFAQAGVDILQGSANLEGSTPAQSWLWRAIYGVVAFLVILLAVMLWFVIARPVQVLPRITQSPAFILTDQDGRWLSDSDLRGSILLINFSSTNCGDRCGAMERNMLAVRDLLRADGRLGVEVRLITISIDADDTPPALRAYAERIGSAPPEWHYLTGAASELKQLIGGEYGVYYNLAGPAIELDQRAVLIDAQGVLRAQYDGAQLDSAIVLRDIGLIQQEANSSDAQRPIYEAAHLFVCYPQ